MPEKKSANVGLLETRGYVKGQLVMEHNDNPATIFFNLTSLDEEPDRRSSFVEWLTSFCQNENRLRLWGDISFCNNVSEMKLIMAIVILIIERGEQLRLEVAYVTRIFFDMIPKCLATKNMYLKTQAFHLAAHLLKTCNSVAVNMIEEWLSASESIDDDEEYTAARDFCVSELSLRRSYDGFIETLDPQDQMTQMW
jgi:hypothetical protein